jgi:hypothetical protein
LFDVLHKEWLRKEIINWNVKESLHFFQIQSNSNTISRNHQLKNWFCFMTQEKVKTRREKFRNASEVNTLVFDWHEDPL